MKDEQNKSIGVNALAKGYDDAKNASMLGLSQNQVSQTNTNIQSDEHAMTQSHTMMASICSQIT